MIVDAHVHLWDLDRNPQPWITTDVAPIARTFGPEELQPLLEAAGVDAVVLVQGACYDADTDYLFELAQDREWIAAVTAWVDLLDSPRAETRLEQLSAGGKLRAVRHLIQGETDRHWITQRPVLRSLAVLEERGLILEVPAVFPLHLDDVYTLARRLPGLRIVVDHLGKPPLGTEQNARLGEAAARCRRARERLRQGLRTEHRASKNELEGRRPAARGRDRLRRLRPRTTSLR